MGVFTYQATDLISGRVLADSIPLNVQSFSAQLNGSGTLSGQLTLDEIYAVNAPFVRALECRRAVLWVLEDGYPVWAGPVWDWPDTSRAQGTLPIQAHTFDSIWSHRLITDTIEYQQVDLCTAFTDLIVYGQSKQSAYIATGVSPAATRTAAYLQTVATNGPVARLVLPTGAAAIAGVPWTASYVWSDLTQISSAWSDMCASGQLEYAFVPGLDSSGNLVVFLRLAYLQLGRPAAQAGYTLSYPGNCLDYGYQRTGSQSSNIVWATAPPNGSAQQWQSVYPHGADLADLAGGYPLMESTASWQGSVVTTQAQIDSWADGQVALKTQAMTLPVITVGGSSLPRLRDITLGDSTVLTATSALHPAKADGSPGLQVAVRVTGWTAYPPGPQQAESYQLTTSSVIAA
ncbi:hypothetical protein OG455_41160 [Kitasatospora sp. NBC_01287]|uniref:hypothetical protein n=1 Tax=Kitasatospora sp. NBC_01287 TaxID=2903573 RepID=UPI0022578E3F|nr:hypothetical protein [Kitasatospora sp. NBC_01287]MCX4750892.1 hypothetical protein [Kitasatospora sp. NBC_01287]MCX4751851.1 hypothetical protein [Kitasatospora sp. NBC_01287]